jgi:hypothetical protein
MREELGVYEESIARTTASDGEDAPKRDVPFLPPRPVSSWSTEGQWSSPADSSLPTPPSTGVFQVLTPKTAESPNLTPGLARTKVGELVAKTTPVKNNPGKKPEAPALQDLNVAAISDVPPQAVPPSWLQEEDKEATKGSRRAILVPAASNHLNSRSSAAPEKNKKAPPKKMELVLPDHDRVKGTEVVLTPRNKKPATTGGFTPAVDEEEEVQPIDAMHCHQLDSDLRRIKCRNQRRAKEDLIYAALERLQDDVQLVVDVEAIFGGSDGIMMFDWFVKTPLDCEGILTGFSKDMRCSIVEKLNLILNEMEMVQTEEFFMSPTNVQEYSGSHDDLRDALLFCRTLVRMALSKTEKESLGGCHETGKWKFLPGLRDALGMLPPPTPEFPKMGGGDSSFFTCPSESDETRTWSNMSFATTLKTEHTAPETKPLSEMNGLHLRQAIYVMATLLQKLTIACHRLGSMPMNDSPEKSGSTWTLETSESLDLTDQIKQTYLELLTMDARDIRLLIDAFEFKTGEENRANTNTESSLIPPPILMETPVKGDADRRSPIESDIFSSPDTEDMMTFYTDDCEEEFEYDDLRRMVGSNDRDDAEEERDGPEERVDADSIKLPSYKRFLAAREPRHKRQKE